MVNTTIASLGLLPVESSQATRKGGVTEIEPNGLPGWRHRDENSRKPRQWETGGQNTREGRVERSCKDRGTGVCRGLLSSLQLSTDQCIHVKKLPKARERPLAEVEPFPKLTQGKEEFWFPPARVQKPYNIWDIRKSTRKGTASIMGKHQSQIKDSSGFV